MKTQYDLFKKTISLAGAIGAGAFLALPVLAQQNTTPGVNPNPSIFNEAPYNNQTQNNSTPGVNPNPSVFNEAPYNNQTQNSGSTSQSMPMQQQCLNRSQSFSSTTSMNPGMNTAANYSNSQTMQRIMPSAIVPSNRASGFSANPYQMINPTGGTSGGHAIQRYNFLAFGDDQAVSYNNEVLSRSVNTADYAAGIPAEGQTRGDYLTRQNQIGQVGYNNSVSTLDSSNSSENSSIYRVTPSNPDAMNSSSGMQSSDSMSNSSMQSSSMQSSNSSAMCQ